MPPGVYQFAVNKHYYYYYYYYIMTCTNMTIISHNKHCTPKRTWWLWRWWLWCTHCI